VELDEFQAILDYEESHWWYRGRLRIVLREVERLAIPSGARILDAGCGSGRVLDALAQFGQVTGVDLSSAAVAAASARGHERVSRAPIEELPFEDSRFHLVTCLDVIEHTDDDCGALRELLRVTRPGGHLLVTAPAYQALWSAHDVRNEHRRRYTRGGLRQVAASVGWELVRDTHFNTLLLAPAAAVRLAGRVREGRRRSELALTPQWLTPVLELPLRLEAAYLGRGGSLPAGLSVAALFTRPEQIRPALRLITERPPTANVA